MINTLLKPSLRFINIALKLIHDSHIRIKAIHHLTLIFLAEKGDKIAGFLFEPIQGEAGVSPFGIQLTITMRCVL